MALACLYSRGLDGLQAPRVQVEAHLANGLPGFALVGLPETEVKESRDRVRAAILNSGFEFPARRITVNLAPADLPKESGRFDLPIAIGILAASGQIPLAPLENHEFAGELSLSGALYPIRGAFAMALAATTAAAFILPRASACEAALAGSRLILGATSLLEVCAHLRGETPLPEIAPESPPAWAKYPDLADVKGQSQARRVLEIAAAGGHSLLMYGPPGSGKSMLAARLPGLLPPLDDAAARESAAVLSLVGRFTPEQYRLRPYRAPHHTASAVALVGGGNPPRPGEISLATGGILFLDEIPEFDRKVLESLREPLERGLIHIARATRQATFPARFQLVAAMNPCPCGWQGHANGRCRCTPEQVRRYRNRISGPLLDRIDLLIEVPALPPETLAAAPAGATSEQVRQRVCTALDHQYQRQSCANAHLEGARLDTLVQADTGALTLLKQAAARMDLSARGWHRILKVARTIADLADSPGISPTHMAEALQYRRPFTEN